MNESNDPPPMVDTIGRTRRLVPLRERWEAKVNRDGPIPETDPSLGRCWLWTGTLLGGPRGGYGAIKRGGVGSSRVAPALAHVVSYELHIGPVPDGLVLDHLCANKPCVNPSHLEPVTRRENLLRGFAARRARRALAAAA